MDPIYWIKWVEWKRGQREKENRLSHAVVAISPRVMGERKAIGGLKTACNCHACPEVYFPFQKVPQYTASHLYQYSRLSFEAFRCSIFLVYFNASFLTRAGMQEPRPHGEGLLRPAVHRQERWSLVGEPEEPAGGAATAKQHQAGTRDEGQIFRPTTEIDTANHKVNYYVKWIRSNANLVPGCTYIL